MVKDAMSGRHARLYLSDHGFSLPEQSADAHAWCFRRAQEGDAVAQCVLSALFNTGLTGYRDAKSAFEWCEIAANGGSQDAQCVLASHFLNGTNVLPQPQRGVALLRELVEAGHVPAMISLGLLMLGGQCDLVPRNDDAAVDLLLAPAHAGDALSQCLVGAQLMLSEEPEVQRAGAKWIARSAEGGFPPAHRYLASFYLRGEYGYPEDAQMVIVHDAIADRLVEE